MAFRAIIMGFWAIILLTFGVQVEPTPPMSLKMSAGYLEISAGQIKIHFVLLSRDPRRR